MIVPADHVGDLHLVVVHDAREVVRGMTVGAQQDEVVEHVVGEGNAAAHDVLPCGLAAGWQEEAQRRHAALALARRPLRRRERAAAAVVARRLAALELLGTPRLQLIGRAVARIGAPRSPQGRGVEVIALAASRLEVGRVATALLGALVPGEAEPAQAAEDGGGGLVGRARRVGVLDAQHERAAVPAGE